MSAGSIKNDITAGMFIDPDSYQFDHGCWPLLIKHMIIRKLSENPRGLSIFELKTKMIQNENISMINIATAIKSLVENSKVVQHRHIYILSNPQKKRSEEDYIDNNDNKSNDIDQQSQFNDVIMSHTNSMDTDDDNDWKTQTNVFTNFALQYKHKHSNECWKMPDNDSVGDKWWNFRRIININDNQQIQQCLDDLSHEDWILLNQITHQQTFLNALSNVLDTKLSERDEYKQKKQRNKNKSVNNRPDILEIIYRVAMKKVSKFMVKYKSEINSEEKDDISCHHIQNAHGSGQHPKIPYSQLSLGQSLIFRTSLLYQLPIHLITDKLQCESDIFASRVSELTNSAEIKKTINQLRSHSLYTVDATRKATYFTLICNNNDDDHDSVYSKIQTLIDVESLDTFGPDTYIYNRRLVPIYNNKISIILKAKNYDIYTNEIEPKIALKNEYQCEWIGSLQNLQVFMKSEGDYKQIKEEVQEWMDNYTVYIHFLRIINKEKAYNCLTKRHFKDYSWNNDEIQSLRNIFKILLKCDSNSTAK